MGDLENGGAEENYVRLLSELDSHEKLRRLREAMKKRSSGIIDLIDPEGWKQTLEDHLESVWKAPRKPPTFTEKFAQPHYKCFTSFDTTPFQYLVAGQFYFLRETQDDGRRRSRNACDLTDCFPLARLTRHLAERFEKLPASHATLLVPGCLGLCDQCRHLGVRHGFCSKNILFFDGEHHGPITLSYMKKYNLKMFTGYAIVHVRGYLVYGNHFEQLKLSTLTRDLLVSTSQCLKPSIDYGEDFQLYDAAADDDDIVLVQDGPPPDHTVIRYISSPPEVKKQKLDILSIRDGI